jgi:nucleotide-binding universal stress UspA family protein
MLLKRILVPLGRSAKDLKSVHYALSLAERLQAQVYILQQASATNNENPRSFSLDEALLDLINTARQAGIKVAHHITSGEIKGEIIEMARVEGIDVLVFGNEDGICKGLPNQLKPLFHNQIIHVKEKDHINYL